MTREKSEARVPSDRRSDIRDEGWIDRVVKVIITHEALIRWAISQSEGREEEEKGSWKMKRWEKEKRLHPDVEKETAV